MVNTTGSVAIRRLGWLAPRHSVAQVSIQCFGDISNLVVIDVSSRGIAVFTPEPRFQPTVNLVSSPGR